VKEVSMEKHSPLEEGQKKKQTKNESRLQTTEVLGLFELPALQLDLIHH